MKRLRRAWRRRRLARAGVRVEIDSPFEVIHDYAICTDRLGRDSVVYSIGVGRHIAFDRVLIDRFGLRVHAFDPTPASIEWIGEQSLPDEFVYHPVGVAAVDGTIEFHPPRRAGSAHFSPVGRGRAPTGPLVDAPVQRLTTIMNSLGHTRIDLLKMDIEGGEYGVITDFLAAGVEIGQFAVEFHHGWRSVPVSRTIAAVEALRDAGFRLFFIGERTYEMSFLREG